MITGEKRKQRNREIRKYALQDQQSLSVVGHCILHVKNIDAWCSIEMKAGNVITTTILLYQYPAIEIHNS
jgi:hypothetical protein